VTVEPSLEAVRGLREKYGEIHALRVEHARGDAADPRPRMRALARRFPGALRELDELPMELIEARLQAIEAALAHGPPFASWPWIALQVHYHARMRAALHVKRLARGRRGEALEQVLLELSAQRGADDADAPALDRAAVGVILEPPGGRLGPWVLAEVARQAGVDPDTVRRALFLGMR
jgi:hypothetical protein